MAASDPGISSADLKAKKAKLPFCYYLNLNYFP